MKIIEKYYDEKGKIKILDEGKRTKFPIFRFKIIKNKTFPCCDFKGKCTNIAYAEVFPFIMGKKKGWSYLCKKHYYEEQKRKKWKLPACLKIED
jgi:hypothetical protein